MIRFIQYNQTTGIITKSGGVSNRDVGNYIPMGEARLVLVPEGYELPEGVSRIDLGNIPQNVDVDYEVDLNNLTLNAKT